MTEEALRSVPLSEITASKRRWQVAVEWTAALALAVLWLAAGLWKLSDITGTQVRMTQVLVPKSLSLVAALLFGAAETFAGVLLLVPRWRRWGAWLSVGLLAAFMAYIGFYYRALTGVDCTCFPWLKRAIGPMFFVHDAALMMVAVVAGWWAPPPGGVRRATIALAAIVLLAGGLLAADRSRGQATVELTSITADGREISLQQDRVFLYFFNPYCPHCFEAAQRMSRLQWQATVVGVPTQALEEARSFFESAGMSGVPVSPDAGKLRESFTFKDVPYAVALENGRIRQKMVFFEEPELSNALREMGFVK